jgi:hypothetical protein
MPVAAYLRVQGRFDHLDDGAIEEIQGQVTASCQSLVRECEQ